MWIVEKQAAQAFVEMRGFVALSESFCITTVFYQLLFHGRPGV
jgi:hypothetical protein